MSRYFSSAWLISSLLVIILSPVSYTHLDVYKRQHGDGLLPEWRRYLGMRHVKNPYRSHVFLPSARRGFTAGHRARAAAAASPASPATG